MTSKVSSPRQSGEFIACRAVNVKILQEGVESLSEKIVDVMEQDPREVSVNRWTLHQLLPQTKDDTALNWVFLSDVLNFSFWCSEEKKYVVDWGGVEWTGYWSLCAALCRAIEEGHNVTDASVMASMDQKTFLHIFRSDSAFQLPMLEQRLKVMREAGKVLQEKFEGKFSKVIQKAEGSAVKLLQLVVDHFESFRDEVEYRGNKLGLYKRAQIVVGDAWACMGGLEPCDFHDVHLITAFADYRVPQALAWLGVLQYEAPLMELLKSDHMFTYGEDKEVEIRGCTIHAVELLAQRVNEIIRKRGSLQGVKVNSIMIDHYLWDLRRTENHQMHHIPFHKVRCIYY